MITTPSSASPTSPTPNHALWSQRAKDMKSIESALQSGNLGAAQAAYAQLTSTMVHGGQANPNSPLAKLGQALQAGNLHFAQTAFDNMRANRGEDVNPGTVMTGTPPGGTTPSLGNNLNVLA